jgi:hypothetical protein
VHWPAAGLHLWCCTHACVCAAKKKQTINKFQCSRCKVNLCAVPCFQLYHTKVNF